MSDDKIEVAEAKRQGWAKLVRTANTAKAKIQEGYDKTKEMVSDGIVTLFGLGGAALVGYLHGRNGAMPAPIGVPLDVALGGAGLLGYVAMMYLQTGREPKDRLRTADVGRSAFLGLSLGVGGYYVGGMFAQLGQKKRKDKGEMKSPEGGRVDYTAKELADKKLSPRNPIVAGDEDRPAITQDRPWWHARRAA